VTGAIGLDPVVVMTVFGSQRVLGPSRLTSYAIVHRDPHLAARVTLAGTATAQYWRAAVGAALAARMAAERADRQRRHPFTADMP
jgi:hypothetical protein